MDPEEIQKRLGFYLQFYGTENVIQAIKYIKRNTNLLSASNDELVAQYGGVEKAIATVARQYATYTRSLVGQTRRQVRQLRQLSAQFSLLSRGIGEMRTGLMSLVLPASFTMAVKTTMSFEKGLLAASARANRLGIGLDVLETGLRGLASTVGFTRQETIDLFRQFEAGMKYVDFGDFRNALLRIREIVGSNREEAQKYLGVLASVSQKYPVLAKQIIQGGKSFDKYNEAQLRALYIAQRLSDQEYRSMVAIIRKNRQYTTVGEERYRQIQDHIKAMQNFRRQVEKVALTWGEMLLPALEKVARVMTMITEGAEKLMKVLGVALLAYQGIKMLTIAKAGPMGMAGLAAGAGIVGGRGLGMGAGRGVGRGLGMGFGGAALMGGALAGRGAPVVGRTGGLAGTVGMTRTGTVGMTGLAAAGMGREARFARGAGTALGSPLTGLGLLLGYGQLRSMRAGYEEKERPVAAGGAGIGEVALGTAGGAWLGAKAGTLIAPGIGTAIGAGVGALVGLLTQWDTLSKSIHRFWKGEMEQLEMPSELAEEIKRIVDEQKYWLEIGRKAEGVVTGPFNAEEYLKLLDQLEDADKRLKKAREKFEEEASLRARARGETWLTSEDFEKEVRERRSEIDAMTAAIGEMSRTGVDKEKLTTSRKIKEQREKELTLLIKQREEEEKSASYLQEGIKNRDEANARVERFTGMISKQKDLVQAINALYVARVDYLDAIIQRMRVTGQIDITELEEGLEKVISNLQERVKAERLFRDILSQELKKMDELGKKEGDISNLRKKDLMEDERLTKEAQKSIEGILEDQIARRHIEEQIQQADARIAKTTDELVKSQLKIVDAYSGQLDYVTLTADRMRQMVSLADNYAIGVGASAQMRMKEFKAQLQIIGVLEEQLAITRKQMRRDKERLGFVPIGLLNRELELNNRILASKVKQAQTVKALRDGWISAISAMNTGAGAFTKIVFTQTKGMAQNLKMAGKFAVLSAKSGSLWEGYARAERFSVYGGIRSAKGFRPAYRIGRGLDELQYLEREERDKLIQQLGDVVDITTKHGLVTLGLQHEFVKSRTVTESQMGVTIDNTAAIRDSTSAIADLSKDLKLSRGGKEQTKEEFREIPGLQKGGIVKKPIVAKIGEAGPEAIVPLGRDKIPVDIISPLERGIIPVILKGNVPGNLGGDLGIRGKEVAAEVTEQGKKEKQLNIELKLENKKEKQLNTELKLESKIFEEMKKQKDVDKLKLKSLEKQLNINRRRIMEFTGGGLEEVPPALIEERENLFTQMAETKERIRQKATIPIQPTREPEVRENELAVAKKIKAENEKIRQEEEKRKQIEDDVKDSLRKQIGEIEKQGDVISDIKEKREAIKPTEEKADLPYPFLYYRGPGDTNLQKEGRYYQELSTLTEEQQKMQRKFVGEMRKTDYFPGLEERLGKEKGILQEAVIDTQAGLETLKSDRKKYKNLLIEEKKLSQLHKDYEVFATEEGASEATKERAIIVKEKWEKTVKAIDRTKEMIEIAEENKRGTEEYLEGMKEELQKFEERLGYRIAVEFIREIDIKIRMDSIQEALEGLDLAREGYKDLVAKEKELHQLYKDYETRAVEEGASEATKKMAAAKKEEWEEVRKATDRTGKMIEYAEKKERELKKEFEELNKISDYEPITKEIDIKTKVDVEELNFNKMKRTLDEQTDIIEKQVEEVTSKITRHVPLFGGKFRRQRRGGREDIPAGAKTRRITPGRLYQALETERTDIGKLPQDVVRMEIRGRFLDRLGSYYDDVTWRERELEYNRNRLGPEIYKNELKAIEEERKVLEEISDNYKRYGINPGDVEPVPMQKGGIITDPTTVLAGEKGPEAIIPLSSNRKVPVELSGLPEELKVSSFLRDIEKIPIEITGLPDELKTESYKIGKEIEKPQYLEKEQKEVLLKQLNQVANEDYIKMKTGGIITKPTKILAGERGPEVVLPLRGQSDTPVMSDVSTISNINATLSLKDVNFHIRIDGAKDVGQQVAKQVESKIRTGVVNALERITI